MTPPWWKLRLVLAIILSVTQCSKIRAAAVVNDAAKSLTPLNDDHSLQPDVKPSTDRDRLSVS